MIKHCMNRYLANDKIIVVSYMQIDIFNKRFCFCEKKIEFDLSDTTMESYSSSRFQVL